MNELYRKISIVNRIVSGVYFQRLVFLFCCRSESYPVDPAWTTLCDRHWTFISLQTDVSLRARPDRLHSAHRPWHHEALQHDQVELWVKSEIQDGHVLNVFLSKTRHMCSCYFLNLSHLLYIMASLKWFSLLFMLLVVSIALWI